MSNYTPINPTCSIDYNNKDDLKVKTKDLSLRLLELNKILFQYHNLKYYIKIILLFQKIVMYKNLKENITLIIITVVLAIVLSIISN